MWCRGSLGSRDTDPIGNALSDRDSGRRRSGNGKADANGDSDDNAGTLAV
ncbi:MAG TPA: hypothetical protein VMM81_09015 [Acidimicrobiia bacterium]|nr:hypothetical protein [Acidimicrobiia bacterium]